MGNPIAYSKSPLIHKTFARQTEQQLSYQAIQVNEGSFPQALAQFQQLGGKGLNITLPFKGDAYHSVDELTPRAEQVQAVNTIWFSADDRRYGDTTDGVGLLRDLHNHNFSCCDKSIIILGAGGAVRSVLPDLLENKPATISIVNRTYSRAEGLVQQFSGYENVGSCRLDELAGRHFDLVINGTSANLNGEMLALPDDLLEHGACCLDMAYADTDTVFVRWAKDHGATVVLDGLGMLVEQAAESFYIWRSVRPETQPVIEMLRNS